MYPASGLLSYRRTNHQSWPLAHWCCSSAQGGNAVTVVEEAAARLGLCFVFVEAIKNPVLIPALEKRAYTIRRTQNGPIDLGDLVLPAQPDDIDAYKLVGKTSPQ